KTSRPLLYGGHQTRIASAIGRPCSHDDGRQRRIPHYVPVEADCDLGDLAPATTAAARKADAPAGSGPETTIESGANLLERHHAADVSGKQRLHWRGVDRLDEVEGSAEIGIRIGARAGAVLDPLMSFEQ